MSAVRRSRAWEFAWRLHAALFRLSGGRLGRRTNGFDVLALTTMGRKSGERRGVALASLEHADGWAVIASYAGEDRHPAWWLNLQAEPMADVQIGSTHTRVRAREATGDEREEILARFVAVDDAYAEYQQRTSRVIPVVVLEPQLSSWSG